MRFYNKGTKKLRKELKNIGLILCTNWLEMLGSRVIAESTKPTPWHAARCNAKMLLLSQLEAPRYAITSDLQECKDVSLCFEQALCSSQGLGLKIDRSSNKFF